MKKFFIFFFLLLLVLNFKIVNAESYLTFDNFSNTTKYLYVPTPYNKPFSYSKIISKKFNEIKEIIFYTGIDFPTISFQIYSENNQLQQEIFKTPQLIGTTTILNCGNTKIYKISFDEPINLYPNWYILTNLRTFYISSSCYYAYIRAIQEIFNFSNYETITQISDENIYNSPLLKIFNNSETEILIKDVNFENFEFSENYFSKIFTSSTPLTFYIFNYKKPYQISLLYFNEKLETYTNLFTFTNVFQSDISDFKVKIWFDNNKAYIYFYDFFDNLISGFWDYYTDKQTFGETLIKISALTLDNKTFEYVFKIKTPLEELKYEKINITLIEYTTTSKKFHQNQNEITLENPNIQILFEGFNLNQNFNYSLSYKIIQTEKNHIFYSNLINIKNLPSFIHLTPLIHLEENNSYILEIYFYRNFQIIFSKNIYLYTGIIQSFLQEYKNFYSNIISNFPGFNSSSTPTPLFIKGASLIDKFFLILPPAEVTEENLNLTAEKISNSLNNFIYIIKKFSLDFPEFFYFFYTLIALIILNFFVKIIKTIKPF